ncbi:MAG: methionine--tRNA ligase, partial [Candidatus Aenigmatarchaeota archaeon]
MSKRILITSALPYANGPLHIGHLAGAYLPADIYTRFQKLKGRDAIHICGTDEHGVAITLSAKKENKTPRELVDYYHENIKNTFDRIGIYFENFSRTTKEIHYKLSQEFFLKIYNKGYIEKREVKQFYCEYDKMFLPDRYIIGICPYCGYDKARGDQCEKCGRWLEPTDLKEPKCSLCFRTPIIKDSFQYFFKLNEFENQLKEYIQSKKDKWKENVLNFVNNWLREGLKPRAITRDLEWGVPVPLEEAKGKVLYVWFDAPIGYISSTIEWNKDKWEVYWKDKDTKIVHFIGKDNIVFHAIVWPAMLMAEGSYNLPDEIPANEFLNLMGDKISTSRNWALWVDELLDRFEPDFIRFFIAYIMPENKDSDFNLY